MANDHPKLRRAARLGAVQALYQMDISGEGVNSVVEQFVAHRFGPTDNDETSQADEVFFEDLVKGVVREQARIDSEIAAHLNEKWSLNRIDKTLRALMRSAGYEIIFRPDIPALVIIDEYVALAGEFFDGKEPGFVNGALDKLAKKIRSAEFGLTGTPAGHG